MSTPAPPAGWYPDPQGVPRSRWWDGARWTEHVGPVPVAVPVAVPAVPPGWAAPARPVGPALAGGDDNTPAVAALVWGLVALVLNPFFLASVVAVVRARQGARRADELAAAHLPPRGRSMVTAAYVLAGLGAAVWALVMWSAWAYVLS